jgi:hypothetical protein
MFNATEKVFFANLGTLILKIEKLPSKVEQLPTNNYSYIRKSYQMSPQK